MAQKDIRWIQRFSNYKKAFDQLEKAVDKASHEELSDLEEQGLIKSFEYTHELAWNVMKDYLEYQGISNITGSRDAIREAFQKGIITDGEIWMDTINSRNRSAHTYNEETANEIAHLVVEQYFPLFKSFLEKMENLRSGEQNNLF